MEDWVNIHEQDGEWTYAANILGGCLVRCQSVRCQSVLYQTESLTFVPGVRVTKEGKLERMAIE
jgi:hypothetical protein